jgi:hypothetical protein
MTRYPSRASQPAIVIIWFGLLCIIGFTLQTVFSAEPSIPANEVQTRIECLTPDGQLSAILRPHTIDQHSATSIINETTVSCQLREGETTFVIALPKHINCDRLTFLNQNAAASGELKIAVSDSHLSANSPDWIEVDGIILFFHKRQFNLSLLGIETRFVRLSFHVDPTQANVGARSDASFRSSALPTAINPRFVKARLQRSEQQLTLGPVAVGQISSSPNN